MNPSTLRRGFSMHRASAAGAQQYRSQWIGVFGPGLAGSPDVASLDLLARAPGLFVDQGWMEAFDKLAVDQDLAGVGRIADQILEDVSGEDDRLHAVVVGLVVAAEGLNAAPVQVLGQTTKAKSAGGVEAKDLLDRRRRLRILSDLAVDTPIA